MNSATTRWKACWGNPSRVRISYPPHPAHQGRRRARPHRGRALRRYGGAARVAASAGGEQLTDLRSLRVHRPDRTNYGESLERNIPPTGRRVVAWQEESRTTREAPDQTSQQLRGRYGAGPSIRFQRWSVCPYGAAVIASAPRPLLFLDVDGPLIPFGATREEHPDGYPTYVPQEASANPLLARVDPALGRKLLALPCDLVWATTWEDEANECIAPLLGLPQLPVVTWPVPSEQLEPSGPLGRPALFSTGPPGAPSPGSTTRSPTQTARGRRRTTPHEPFSTESTNATVLPTRTSSPSRSGCTAISGPRPSRIEPPSAVERRPAPSLSCPCSQPAPVGGCRGHPRQRPAKGDAGDGRSTPGSGGWIRSCRSCFRE
ncbi:hypothetical protein SAMN05216251_102552 [Actinacidiphila alni]|uniref:Uncharacterized protein n=1 Tax=Actinacidiphila alni TaxID=380248 RepID=A0A1I1ZRR8_9ACTN|nr:hypothetical protein SAMN05216251_102552 [Actinacidiphila alni]